MEGDGESTNMQPATWKINEHKQSGYQQQLINKKRPGQIPFVFMIATKKTGHKRRSYGHPPIKSNQQKGGGGGVKLAKYYFSCVPTTAVDGCT